MTPLGHGILTGITEVDDPIICDTMHKMLSSCDRREVNQTVLDLSALTVALASALGECRNASASDVLDCVLAR
jgi:hypothetical protein